MLDIELSTEPAALLITFYDTKFFTAAAFSKVLRFRWGAVASFR